MYGRHRPHRPHCLYRQSGQVSVTEVLLALLLVVLGTLYLMRVGETHAAIGRDAMQRAGAARLVSELVSWTGVAAANPARAGELQQLLMQPPATGAVPDCFADPCGARDAIGFLLAEWQVRVESGRPGMQSRFCVDAGDAAQHVHAWRWPCMPGAAAQNHWVVKLAWPAAGRQQADRPQLVAMLGLRA